MFEHDLQQSHVILLNARLLDGTGVEERQVSAIEIKDGRIAGVYDCDTPAPSPTDAAVIDLGGALVLPGLWDAHAHLSYTPQPGTPLTLNYTHSLEFNTMVAAKNAATYLRHGFTSIAEVGCRGNISVALRDAVASGLTAGPRIIAAGEVISSTGGLMANHPEWMALEHANGRPVDGIEQARREVRRQVHNGVNHLKVGITGQMAGPNAYHQLLTEPELAAIVDEGARFGRMVGVHVYGKQALNASLNAGVQVLHHLFGGLNPDSVERMDALGAYLVPTLMVFQEIQKHEIFKQWKPRNQSFFTQNIDEYLQALSSIAGTPLAKRVLVGSDTGNSIPQGNTGREIAALLDLGFSLPEVIQAATLNPATLFGRADELGSIEVGKLADLVVIDPAFSVDPTVVDDAERVHGVFQSGVLVAARGTLRNLHA